MTLYEGLLWLMGVGAGILAFWIIDRLERTVSDGSPWRGIRTWLLALELGDKRLVTFGLTVLIAWAAWGAGMLMLYVVRPENWRALVEGLFSTGAAAIIAANVAHGRVTQHRRREAGPQPQPG